MTEGAEVTPQLKFEAGVNRALKYGEVFMQGEPASNSQDAANGEPTRKRVVGSAVPEFEDDSAVGGIRWEQDFGVACFVEQHRGR